MKIPYHRPIKLMYGNPVLSNGSWVRQLEASIKELYDVEYVFACSSASIGLLISLQAYKNTHIFSPSIPTPAFGWFSSEWAARISSFKPQFTDIDKNTWLMKRSTNHNILPIHTFGNIGIYKTINTIYDGAHALGSKIKDFGLATVMSLAPTKPITAQEGGLILTNDSDMAKEIEFLRDKVSRMSELNAEFGSLTLEHLEEILTFKKKVFKYYKKHLKGVFQKIPHNTNYATIGFLTDLKIPKEEIETRQYYEPLKKGLPNTDYVYSKMVCLPSWLGVDYEDVVNKIMEFNEDV